MNFGVFLIVIGSILAMATLIQFADEEYGYAVLAGVACALCFAFAVPMVG